MSIKLQNAINSNELMNIDSSSDNNTIIVGGRRHIIRKGKHAVRETGESRMRRQRSRFHGMNVDAVVVAIGTTPVYPKNRKLLYPRNMDEIKEKSIRDSIRAILKNIPEEELP